MPTMNISLTPQLEQWVRDKVASGFYNSASEVVREALRLLNEQDRFREMRLEELRKELQKGIDELDRGAGTPWDKETFLAEARARLEAKQQQQES